MRKGNQSEGTVSFISQGVRYYYSDIALLRLALESAAGLHSTCEVTVTMRCQNRKSVRLSLKDFIALVDNAYTRYSQRMEIEKIIRESGENPMGRIKMGSNKRPRSK